MDESSGAIRTEAEGRELWLPYAMEFLRNAEIRQITLWDENPDGGPRIIERKLIGTLRMAEDAPASP
jgi:hypothetical protein